MEVNYSTGNWTYRMDYTGMQFFWDKTLCRWISGSRGWEEAKYLLLSSGVRRSNQTSWPLKMKILRSIATLRITHPTIQCRIPEDIHPLEQGCGNRTSRTDFNFRYRILRKGLLKKAVHLRVLENAISSQTEYLQDEVFTAKKLTCE
jgi:hypothetical protein